MFERHSALPLILAAALIAAVAGVTGALLVAAYVLPPTIPEAGTGRASSRPSAEDVVDANALAAAAAATVRVYVGVGTATPAGAVYAPDALRGAGVVLTADGWIVLDRSIGSTDAVFVSSAGRKLAVERSVDAPALGVIFVKTDGADLHVMPFGDSRALSPGTTLFVPEVVGYARVPFVTAAARDGLPAQSETTADMRRRIVISQVLPAGSAGAPLVTARGEFVGIALAAKAPRSEEGTRALPVEVLRPALDRVLADGTVHFADIGVRGLPISAAAIPDPTLAARGGWLVTEVHRPTSGLLVGDLVRSVGSDPVTPERPLPEILAEYAADAHPELLVLRAGAEIRVPVSLAP